MRIDSTYRLLDFSIQSNDTESFLSSQSALLEKDLKTTKIKTKTTPDWHKEMLSYFYPCFPPTLSIYISRPFYCCTPRLSHGSAVRVRVRIESTATEEDPTEIRQHLRS